MGGQDNLRIVLLDDFAQGGDERALPRGMQADLRLVYQDKAAGLNTPHDFYQQQQNLPLTRTQVIQSVFLLASDFYHDPPTFNPGYALLVKNLVDHACNPLETFGVEALVPVFQIKIVLPYKITFNRSFPLISGCIAISPRIFFFRCNRPTTCWQEPAVICQI